MIEAKAMTTTNMDSPEEEKQQAEAECQAKVRVAYEMHDAARRVVEAFKGTDAVERRNALAQLGMVVELAETVPQGEYEQAYSDFVDWLVLGQEG
jgi:hypothetical protein